MTKTKAQIQEEMEKAGFKNDMSPGQPYWFSQMNENLNMVAYLLANSK